MCCVPLERIYQAGEHLPPIRVTWRNAEQDRILFKVDRMILQEDWWEWFFQFRRPYEIDVRP